MVNTNWSASTRLFRSSRFTCASSLRWSRQGCRRFPGLNAGLLVCVRPRNLPEFWNKFWWARFSNEKCFAPVWNDLA